MGQTVPKYLVESHRFGTLEAVKTDIGSNRAWGLLKQSGPYTQWYSLIMRTPVFLGGEGK